MMLQTLGTDLRNARLAAAVSQASVGRASGMSDAKVSRIEAGVSRRLTLVDAVLLADAVGLDLSLKTYPGRSPTRDAAHARRLQSLLAHVGAPLRHATEVLLPARDGVPERRAWDALIRDVDGDTGVELEQRLYDVQAQTRRVLLKWRDSGAERLLLVVADTRGNRRVLAEFADYFQQLPRLRTSRVLGLLEAGIRPPTGLMLL
jgi:transcriptional regulator with XRE-family HTH domain